MKMKKKKNKQEKEKKDVPAEVLKNLAIFGAFYGIAGGFQ